MTMDTPEEFLKRNGRFEIKFIVLTSLAHLIRERLSYFMTIDPYAIERGFYFNRSLYFDSPTFIEYAEYVNGEKRRRKVRFRRYTLDSDVINFEIKQKLNRIIWKDKEECSLEDAHDLATNPWDWLEHKRLGTLAVQLIHRSYEPKVTVVYQRVPFRDVIDGRVRITFDFNIRCGLPELFERETQLNDLRVLPPGFEVMEAKFNGAAPKWFRNIIADFQLSACTYSKYAQSIDRLYFNEKIIEDAGQYG